MFYGFSYSTNLFSQSIYITTMASGALEVVTTLIPFFILSKAKTRRMPLWLTGMMLLLACSIISWTVPTSELWVCTVLLYS